jgi:hypothetical protein
MTTESTSAAYGVYAEDVPVIDVVHTLNDAGFNKEDICLMFARTHPISIMVRQVSIFTTDREATAVTAGMIEWLSEFGAVVIRTFGFFIRSETFLSAMVTAKDAPALCGNSDTLVGLGFPEEDACRLESQLSDAGAMVYVACSEHERAEWARVLLQQIGAQETAELDRGRESQTAVLRSGMERGALSSLPLQKMDKATGS